MADDRSLTDVHGDGASPGRADDSHHRHAQRVHVPTWQVRVVYGDGASPELLRAACQDAGIDAEVRMQEGYDHSYFFISTFMAEHVAWHARRLRA